MKTVIKIGVTYTGTEEKHGNYEHWLRGNENIEIIILSPVNTEPKSIKNLDGIVLSGGLDMHPNYYQSDKTDYPNAPVNFNEIRDKFEVAVFKICHQNDIPLLAICRGMQLVNCVLGGTLTQDIGLVANAIHRYEINDKAHGINIVAGTLLNEITGVERSVTNSAHHQSIKILGKGLSINCTSDDGIIEGVEWVDQESNPFFIGVQWHPERMYKFHLGKSPVTKNIRDRFIMEIKKSIESLS